MNFAILFLLTCVVSLTQAIVNQPGCGRRPRLRADADSDRIVGGRVAASGDYGWQAGITVNGQHICGGSLIHPQWVLTAAHCLAFGKSPSIYSITIGVHDKLIPERHSQFSRVSKIISHASYSEFTNANDIALFKLATPVKVNNDTIVLACLQESPVDLSGRLAWVTGWGRTTTAGSQSRQKQEVSKPVVSYADCRRAFGSIVNQAIHLCAGKPGLGRDTCQGDSGGPLVVQDPITKLWNQAGVVSFGAKACGDGGVYTKVSAYTSWIRQQIMLN